MNKGWIKIFIAVFFEVFWVVGLKHADDFWTWAGTVISIGVSFYLLFTAGKTLPVGTVYAVFTGMGAAGTVFVGIVFFGEPVRPAVLVLIGILLAGVIGLKLVTDESAEKGAES